MVTNKKKILYFTCLFVKYKNIIAHSDYCLTELEIQVGFNKFSIFWKRVGIVSRYSTFNFAFAYIFTMEDPRTGNPMDFTPAVEDEVIR